MNATGNRGAPHAAREAFLDAYWMPFTDNRYFKRRPKLLVAAEGAYYTMHDGRRLFDCLSGLWCSGLGHAHPKVTEAIAHQARELDYSPSFQVGHPKAFELANRLASMAPVELDRIFFTNSGSEAVDTALKIALAYHRLRGEASRTRFIGREKAYHGVGFGGTSVGGLPANRKMFSPLLLPGVDHLPHTYDPAHMAYSRGQPTWGGHLANELERLIALHDASTIAAVIVEPMQGSAGVIVPPVGYLSRLREICDRHGILLIFDEVITGFGRLGHSFGAHAVKVTPDIITFAKCVTNGTVPMGGVIVRRKIHDSFMQGPDHLIEFFHGYTYSGHPIAVAAALATMQALNDEDAFGRSRTLSPILEEAMHDLRGEPHVTDIRNFGLSAAVDFEPIKGKPGLRAIQVFELGLEEGLLLRFSGDCICVAPPFISEPEEIKRMADGLRRAIRGAL